MKIEIWSDVMCPFCYIGKKNFEAALNQIPYKEQINVIWKSYQLDQELSATSPTNTLDYLKEKKGLTDEQITQLNDGIIQFGKEVDIVFNQENALAVNTSDAHRFIQFAQTKGLDSEAEEILFKAYFTDGKNVADFEVLSELGANIGLNKTEVTEMLNSDAFVFEVASDGLDAKNIGVTSVPFFVIDRKYAMSGAQPIEYFVSALTQAYEKDYLNNTSSLGNSCEVDGNC